MTGAGTAATLGYPDYGLVTMSEMADNAGRIAAAVEAPVIADADTGYGNELNATRTVREYERRGVAGAAIAYSATDAGFVAAKRPLTASHSSAPTRRNASLMVMLSIGTGWRSLLRISDSMASQTPMTALNSNPGTIASR